MRNAVLVLDIALIIRRIFIALENAALALLGTKKKKKKNCLLIPYLLLAGIEEEKEAEEKLYTKNLVLVNVTPKELKVHKKLKMITRMSNIIA